MPASSNHAGPAGQQLLPTFYEAAVGGQQLLQALGQLHPLQLVRGVSQQRLELAWLHVYGRMCQQKGSSDRPQHAETPQP